jgi:hypothetical protein
VRKRLLPAGIRLEQLEGKVAERQAFAEQREEAGTPEPFLTGFERHTSAAKDRGCGDG